MTGCSYQEGDKTSGHERRPSFENKPRVSPIHTPVRGMGPTGDILRGKDFLLHLDRKVYLQFVLYLHRASACAGWLNSEVGLLNRRASDVLAVARFDIGPHRPGLTMESQPTRDIPFSRGGGLHVVGSKMNHWKTGAFKDLRLHRVLNLTLVFFRQDRQAGRLNPKADLRRSSVSDDSLCNRSRHGVLVAGDRE